MTGSFRIQAVGWTFSSDIEQNTARKLERSECLSIPYSFVAATVGDGLVLCHLHLIQNFHIKFSLEAILKDGLGFHSKKPTFLKGKCPLKVGTILIKLCVDAYLWSSLSQLCLIYFMVC